MTRPPLVLVDRIVLCHTCDAEVRIITDGLSAYVEQVGTRWDGEGGTRSSGSTIVEVLCPAPDVVGHYIDEEVRCHAVLMVDLSARDAWTPATTDGISRLSLAGRLDG
jgi:hypothetical protein